MKTRHVGLLGVLTTAMVLLPETVLAQDPMTWRIHFAAGEEARRQADDERYAREMARAAQAMPDGLLNRPFVQYHAARAAALVGDEEAALAWLRAAWEEEIEALMISFARHDPAFSDMSGTEPFEALMEGAGSVELSVRSLADGVDLVQGAGSNLLAVATRDGTLLVDTGYGPALRAVQRAVGSSVGGPIRHVILTHPHEDHVGATPGLGGDARIYAHPGTAEAMREPFVFIEGVSVPPKPARALPDVEIERDTVLDIGDVEVRIVPTVAHTTGDLSVYLPEARVAHLGDTYLAANPMMYPGREDPQGFLDRLEAFLDTMHPETAVVGGHEEVADLDAVRAQIVTSRDAMALVRDAMEEGRTMEEAAASAGERFPPQWIAFFWGVLQDEESG